MAALEKLTTALRPGDPDDGDEGRQTRGMAIALLARDRITRKRLGYSVPSQSSNGSYIVALDGEEPWCSCPDFEARGLPCKHVYAVTFWLAQRTETANGQILNPGMDEERAREVVMCRNKPTYAQDWPAYNAAQSHEGEHFPILLRGLCNFVEPLPYVTGRRPLPIGDVVFALVMKVYSMMSGRRAMERIREAERAGLISRIPSYNAAFAYMADSRLSPELQNLVRLSALPLRDVETHFSPDSTGFSESRYRRWFGDRGNVQERREYLKVQAICGVKSNIITDVMVSGHGSDAPYLESLVETTARSFNMEEVSADKGYLSRANFLTIQQLGATPLIPFRINSLYSQGRRPQDLAWNNAYAHFMLHREDFRSRYHLRSNIESCFGAVKAKFGDYVRSTTPTAQENEIFAKVLAYNITVLIHVAYELGIDPAGFSRQAGGLAEAA